MGLKYSWSVKDAKPCCGNCIHMFEKRVFGGFTSDVYGQKVSNAETRFYCKVGTKIPDNHWTNENISVCCNHRYSKSFKTKKRVTKNKLNIVIKKQVIKRTVIKKLEN